MKKNKGVSLLLALALTVQSVCVGALATEAEQPATETQAIVTEVTEATDEIQETVDATEATGEATDETTGETTDETTGETVETEPPTEAPTEDPNAIPDVPEGANAPVEYGCNTLDAGLPVVRNESILRSAKGVFVYEVDSDTALYGYNQDACLAPGGLVQILNALLVLENCKLDDVVTVGTQYINQLPIGVRHQSLRNGEQITVRDLLYCMVLSSANDAAVVLSQRVAGEPQKFIEMMNEKAKDLGCTDTVIKTVSGLDAEGQYTTARDMARILKAAMENEDFRTIFGTGTYTVPATNKSEARELKTMNYLQEGASMDKYYDERVIGGKASYTSSAAGASIAFAAQNEDLNLVCVILGATRKYNSDKTVSRYGNFEEARDLMKYCFGQFRVSRMLYSGQPMLQLEVAGGTNDVVAMNKSNVDIVLPNDARIQDLRLIYEVAGGRLTAPLEAGEQIVTMQMWYRGSCVGETTLYAQTAVATADDPGFTIQDGAVRSDEDMAKMLLYVGVVFLGICALFGIYLAINAARRAAARRRARKRRRQQRDARMQSRRR